MEHRKFELTKPLWDTVSLERIDVATDVTRKADLAAVVMQEGLANVCLVTASMTLVRKKIEVNIPRYILSTLQALSKDSNGNACTL